MDRRTGEPERLKALVEGRSWAESSVPKAVPASSVLKAVFRSAPLEITRS
jgi:hypothetical protein